MTRYPKNWESESINKYFTQESRQKDREQFDETHVSIEKIKVEQDQVFSNLLGDDSDYINEDQALKGILDSKKDDSNRLFFVVGESGCGKSELCQWLEYRIAERRGSSEGDEFVHQEILVPRNVREPREVIQILGDHLGEDFEDARLLSELPPEGVFQQTRGTITNQFTPAEEYTGTRELLKDEKFKQVLKENLEDYISTFDEEIGLEFEPIPIEKVKDLLEDYPRARREHEDRPAPPEKILYDKITEGSEKAIRDMLELGDIKPLLGRISEEFKQRNKRPVLIIEDLAGFTIYQHEILSFFSDLQASNWDVVMGLTTGIDEKLSSSLRADKLTRDTINDRTQARLVMTEQTDEGSRTLFLEQEDVHLSLAKKYLDAIKNDSDAEFGPGIGIPDNEIEETFDGLYPFNKEFLNRVYENLQEGNTKKQTPRIYLKFVLEDLLDNENPPFEHADILGRLGNIRNTIDPEYDGEDEKLMKWYGKEGSDNYKVDTTIPEVFDVESDGEVPTVSGPGSKPRPGTGPGTGSDTGPDHFEIYEGLKNELLAWKRGESSFDRTENIEQGAVEVLTFFYDNPNSLIREEASNDSAYISWDKGSAKVPVHIDNGDEPNYTMVELSPDMDKDVLLQLLYIGVFDEKSVLDHFAEGNADLLRLRSWSDRVVDEYRDQLESDIKEGFGASLDEISLFGKYICCLYSGNGHEYTHENLKKPIDGEFNPALAPTPSGGNLPKQASPNEIEPHVDLLEGLFQARFHLRENVVNHNRLEKWVGNTDIDTLTDEMIKINRNGPKGFKIGPNKKEAVDLKEFLTSPSKLNLRGFAQDLSEYQGNYYEDRSQVLGTLSEVTDLYSGAESPSEIVVEELDDAYDTTGLTKPDCLEELGKMEEERFREVVSHMRATLNEIRNADNVWKFLHSYRMFGELRVTEYKDEFRTLKDVSRKLDSLEQRLDDIIEDGEVDPVGYKPRDFIEAQRVARSIPNNINEGTL